MVNATASRRFESVLAALRHLGRYGLRLDSNPVPATWTHVTKVDPEDEKVLPLLTPLYLGHTSAVSVGGSRSVDADNTEETFRLLSWAAPPVFHEPSAATHVTAETRAHADFLAIPEVLNGDSSALVGTLGAGIDHIRTELVPAELDAHLPSWLPTALTDRLADVATSWLLSDAVFEAYVVQNPDSAAARESGVGADDVLSADEARRRALAAERHLGSEILYLEYSGTFGGEEAVEALSAISESVSWSRVWYGGGLADADDVRAVREAGADTVVVGDVFHRVADEERDVCARAVDALAPDASRRAVREWVEDAVDRSDAAAVDYLDTIPAVDDAASLARRYLVATVQAWLALDALDADADESAVDDAVDALFARSALDDLTGAGGRRYLRTVARAHVGRDETFPLAHLGVARDD